MSLEKLRALHKRKLEGIKPNMLKRYLFKDVDWTSQLNFIVGMRGVGKTTMMLQYIKEIHKESQKALYISADNTLLQKKGLFETAWEFEQNGGRLLAIDEIHKYNNWNQELKNIYDSFDQLKVVVSGSSSVSIIKGQYDLSRRALLYKMKGLSFREYLNFGFGEEILSEISFDDIIKNHEKIEADIIKKVKKEKKTIQERFKRYLNYGYYPYYLQGVANYQLRLSNAISKVLYEDIPAVYKVNTSAVHTMQKMLLMIASSAPYSPNVLGIATDLGISRDTVYDYLDYLEKAGLLNFLYRGNKGAKISRKPEKIYLDNSNLFHSLAEEGVIQANIGGIREAYFLNQLQAHVKIYAPESTDFVVDGKYYFEVGGSNKSKKQIKDLKNAFVVKDGIDYGSGNVIPLWLFGFLY